MAHGFIKKRIGTAALDLKTTATISGAVSQKPDVKGKSQQGYLWVYSRPKSDVLFEWRVSRSRTGPEEFLKNFRGKLQTDGYSAYESLAKARGDLTLIGCWAHCRRGFHEALAETRLAAWFVRQIGLLYVVERLLREKKAGPRLRAAMRTWQSRPVLERLRRAMELVRMRLTEHVRFPMLNTLIPAF